VGIKVHPIGDFPINIEILSHYSFLDLFENNSFKILFTDLNYDDSISDDQLLVATNRHKQW
jgi:hypothetical protein